MEIDATNDLLAWSEPLSDTLRKHVISQGYTDLRFNPGTMVWAYHKSDQVVGDDGRRYVRAVSS